MLKPVLGVAAAGVIGLALLKVLSLLLLPVVGTVLALVLTVLKVALVVGVVFFLVWLFRRKSDGEAPSD